jgi:arylsulfatase A-like enzyme
VKLLPALVFVSWLVSVRAAPVNFVVILVDDLGYGDVPAFYEKAVARTPALDRMAKEGMKLTSFYAAPVCTPSRAQVMTGCYAKRVSLPHVLHPAARVGLNPEERTLPERLKERGYATMCIGKWHLGDQPEFLPTKHGFDHYFGIPYSNDMGGDWDGTGDPPPGKRKPPLPLMRDDNVIEVLNAAGQDAITSRYTDDAVAFLQAHTNTPFFLYLPHTAVHVPLHPGEAFRGKSKGGAYADWVEEVDASTGRVLDALRELHLATNTLVIFTSDNGPWLTQGERGGNAGPLRGGKGGTFEGGVRVPTLAWWPGRVPANTTRDAVAGNIDLLPTLTSLAGGSVGETPKVDGADLTSLLTGQTNVSPREAHYYFSGERLEAVRSGRWKLAITPQKEWRAQGEAKQSGVGTAGVPRLYDLQSDPGETTDVAGQHPDEVRRLTALTQSMTADLGATGNGPGVRPPGRANDPRPLLFQN